MNDEAQWTALERIFHAALALEPGQRAKYVQSVCGEDEDLRAGFNRSWFAMMHLHPRETEQWQAAAGPSIGPYQVLSSSAPAAWATSTSCSTAVSAVASR